MPTDSGLVLGGHVVAWVWDDVVTDGGSDAQNDDHAGTAGVDVGKAGEPCGTGKGCGCLRNGGTQGNEQRAGADSDGKADTASTGRKKVRVQKARAKIGADGAHMHGCECVECMKVNSVCPECGRENWFDPDMPDTHECSRCMWKPEYVSV